MDKNNNNSSARRSPTHDISALDNNDFDSGSPLDLESTFIDSCKETLKLLQADVKERYAKDRVHELALADIRASIYAAIAKKEKNEKSVEAAWMKERKECMTGLQLQVQEIERCDSEV